jgi:sarcosine oxidase, subunit beta
MFGQLRFERMWSRSPLKKAYEVVIIGAGVHGLATAYHLAKDGVRNIAVLEKGYLGCGNSGRNTAIIRSNYRTPEGILFYDESLKLYEELSGVLKYNVMFSQQGHLTLAHTDSTVNGLRIRAETNQALGVDSRMVYPDEIKRLVPVLNLSQQTRYPILAALYHPPGGIIRHDAVVWGYAREAGRMGVEIHPHTEVLSIGQKNGGVDVVRTNRGDIQSRIVVNATSGWSTTVARMLNVDLPIVSHPLQACVTEPMKPLLDKVLVSANLHVYISQTPRGEFVMGSEIDPYQSYSYRSTFPTLQMIVSHAIELVPQLARVRILRQWSGVCDMTPDYSPIIGDVPQVKGFYLDVGWGTYGFKAGPVAGKYLAKFIESGQLPDLIRPFSLMRFYEGNLVGEKAAAAVSH